ncbi:hypothetical protein KR009_010682 [Drosophila setifemur]|nr:hypothetical protein KR009_010682 [Drosophila setifemur]
MSTKRAKSPRKRNKANVVRPRKDPSAIRSIICPPIDKPKKQKPEEGQERDCPHSKNYRSPADKRIFLEQQVVPILMEGMLGLAREMPRDPICYLKKFWLQDKHKCDIQLPRNTL